MMDDTPSNYDIANQRLHTNRKLNKMVRIDDQAGSSNGGDVLKKKSKRKKKVVQEYNEPSDKDVQMAKAYGGVAKGPVKRTLPKGLNAKGLNSPGGSSISRQSKKLKVISGSVAGLQKNLN